MPNPTSSLRDIPTGIWVLGSQPAYGHILGNDPQPASTVHGDHFGASATFIELIEGLAESTALIIKVFSGVLSDYLGKRKWLAVQATVLGAPNQTLVCPCPDGGLRCIECAGHRYRDWQDSGGAP